jgi:hypothetical protein
MQQPGVAGSGATVAVVVQQPGPVVQHHAVYTKNITRDSRRYLLLKPPEKGRAAPQLLR